MRSLLGPIVLLWLATFTFSAEPDRLVTISAGKVPIILSAPHGGRTPVPGVPVRIGQGVPDFVTVLDNNTHELAELIAKVVEKRFGGRPYLVAARFERRFIDANRPETGAFESEQAKPYYRAYHQALENFTKEVQKKWKRGLLLDIHGQGTFRDALVRGTNNGKTVELLIQRHGRAALIGSKSLFGRFAGAGYKVVPPVDSEELEDRRYSGGYIVRTYGSHQGNGIDAIQLEFGSELRRTANLAKTASVLGEALEHFCRDFLPEALKTTK